MIHLKKYISSIHALCQRYGVKKLYFFGSAMTERFDEKSSDVDVLVEMLPMPPIRRGENLTRLWVELEQLFRKKVDLLTPQSLRNPYLKQEIEQTKRLVYDHQSQEIPV